MYSSSEKILQVVGQLALLVPLLMFPGCTEDITYSSRFGKPLGGRCLLLRKDCTISSGIDNTDFQLWCSPVDPRKEAIPSSIDGYNAEIIRTHYSRISKGTRIRITKLSHEKTIENEYFFAYGMIESGPLKGKSVFIYSFVRWKIVGDTAVPDQAPDPDYFENCADASTSPSAGSVATQP